jgi:hypothetical protein
VQEAKPNTRINYSHETVAEPSTQLISALMLRSTDVPKDALNEDDADGNLLKVRKGRMTSATGSFVSSTGNITAPESNTSNISAPLPFSDLKSRRFTRARMSVGSGDVEISSNPIYKRQ